MAIRKGCTRRTKVDKIDVTADGKFAHVLRPAAKRVPSSKDIKKDCGIRVKWFEGSLRIRQRNYSNVGDYVFIAQENTKVKCRRSTDFNVV